MKLNIKLAAASAYCICAVSTANTAGWYSPDSAFKCVEQGSPADRVRELAAQGISAEARGKGSLEGIVSVSYLLPDGQRAAEFFYPSKSTCEEMISILVPVDAKYE